MTEKVKIELEENLNLNVNLQGFPSELLSGTIPLEEKEVDHETLPMTENDLNYTLESQYMMPDEDIMPYIPVKIVDAPEQRVFHFFRSYLDQMLTMAITGMSGEGKTSILCAILNEHRGRKPIVFFRHPDKESFKGVITDQGRTFHFIDGFDWILRLRRAIVVIDEPQLLFPGRKGFDNLLKFMSIARHRQVTLIFCSNESRWFQARIEAFIQAWVLKDQDPDLIKRGSKMIKIIKRAFPDTDNFRLNVNEFLFYSRKFDVFSCREGEVYTFEMPSWFTDRISRCYENAEIPQAKVEPLPVIITK